MKETKETLHKATPAAQVAMPLAEPTPQAPQPTAATAAPSVMGWSCAKCRYVAAMSDGSFQCRQDPPTYIQVGSSGPVVAAWPPVMPADWCGIYAPSP